MNRTAVATTIALTLVTSVGSAWTITPKVLYAPVITGWFSPTPWNVESTGSSPDPLRDQQPRPRAAYVIQTTST